MPNVVTLLNDNKADGECERDRMRERGRVKQGERHNITATIIFCAFVNFRWRF